MRALRTNFCPEVHKKPPKRADCVAGRMKNIEGRAVFEDLDRKKLRLIIVKRDYRHKNNLSPCLRSKLPLPIRRFYKKYIAPAKKYFS